MNQLQIMDVCKGQKPHSLCPHFGDTYPLFVDALSRTTPNRSTSLLGQCPIPEPLKHQHSVPTWELNQSATVSHVSEGQLIKIMSALA